VIVEYQKTVKRTIYVAECKCDPEEGWRDVKDANPPREKMCPKCGKWVTYKEETATSPEYKKLLTE
jgi:hypothetical protein